jgi:hypothetical protein
VAAHEALPDRPDRTTQPVGQLTSTTRIVSGSV